MSRFLSSVGVFAMVSLLVMACSKVGVAEEKDPNTIDNSDNTPPVLTIIKPTANQVYANGDSIIVEGKAVDEKVMYKGKVQIKNEATGLIVAEASYETHFLNTMNFRFAYKAVVTVQTDFTAIIDFQDHGANSATSTIKVKVNP